MSSDYLLKECNWEVTLACTLNCIHCGSKAGRARGNELSIDECLRVAEELVRLGCKNLTMIGGEVFLFKHWEEICLYLSDGGVKVNIVSNGYNIKGSEIEQIKRAKLVNIGISIDGMEENHNKIRGREDAFLRVKNTLELLHKENIEIGVLTTVMNFNYGDIEYLYQFLVKHHVKIWQLQLANPMGNMLNKHEFSITPHQVQGLTDFIRKKNRDKRMAVIAADSIGYFNDNETYIRGGSSPICYWRGCGAGVSSIFIDSTGNVKGCGALYADNFIEGNVRTNSLSDIWNNKDAFSYNRKFTTDLLTGKCKECDVGEVCKGGCRSSNYFSTNSLYSSAFCCRNQPS